MTHLEISVQEKFQNKLLFKTQSCDIEGV